MSTLVRAWCDCGFHGEYPSQARAAYAMRRHDCDRWRTKRATARRGFERRRGVDRTPKTCQHKQARHVHGTYACYVLDACRCQPCATANSAYELQRRRNLAYGRSDLIDAGPVRDHIGALAAAGIGLKTLAVRAGVGHGTLWKIVYGVPSAGRPPSARVHAETAAKILAVPADGLAAAAEGARIRSTGTARRLRALVALGWSVSKLCERSGVDRQALDPLLDEAGDFWRLTHARHARSIRDLYERLSNTNPPEVEHRDKIAAARSRARALAAGWPPPAAWDDDEIDDPAALPAPGWRGTLFGECSVPGCATPRSRGLRQCQEHYYRERRGSTGRRIAALDLDDFAHLVGLGEHPERAAARLGFGLDAIVGSANAAGRTDVVRLLDQLAAA